MFSAEHNTKHYKSWSELNKKLNEMLCDELKGRVKYFLTSYHNVHDSYGRAAVLVDNKEVVCFSWDKMYVQEADVSELHGENKTLSYCELKERLKPAWDKECIYYERNFLDAVLEFRNMSINEALASGNYIIKMLAILDKRVGKRTLAKIAKEKEFENYPCWGRQFYELRVCE